MRYWKKFVACLTALMFIVMMLALAGCQFVVIGPSGSTGSDSTSSDSTASDSVGSGGSSGGSVPGEDESGEETEDEIKQSLYEAFELDDIRGLNATLKSVGSGSMIANGEYGADARQELYTEATAAWDDDGVLSADAYYIRRDKSLNGNGLYAYGGFARNVDFFDGGYECYTILASDAVDDSASLEDSVSAIRKYIVDNQDEIIAESHSIDWLSMICDTAGNVGETRQAYFEALGVLLGAVEQVPAFFGGGLEITETGYTLTYSMEACIDLFCNYILKGVLEAVDENPEMTCEEFAGLDEIVLLSDMLFADYAAEDMQGLLRVAVKELMVTGMGGVPADVVSKIDFNAIFPAITDGQTAGEYLRACVADFQNIVRSVMHELGETDTSVVDGLTPRMWMEQLLYAVGKIEVPDDGKLLDAFTKWYQDVKADWAAYGEEASFTLIFNNDRVPVGLDIYISAEKETVGDDMGFTFLLDGHLDFCYEAPELFDLTGYKYYAGERMPDAELQDVISWDGFDVESGTDISGLLGATISVRENGGRVVVTLSDDTGVLATGELFADHLNDQTQITVDGMNCIANFSCNADIFIDGVRIERVSVSIYSEDESGWLNAVWNSAPFETEPIYETIA